MCVSEVIFDPAPYQSSQNTQFTPKKYPKNLNERQGILEALENSFLTKNLNCDAKETIVDSMYESNFKTGQNIIS